MDRNDLLLIAQRLREYVGNPHHIDPISQAFKQLIVEASESLSQVAALQSTIAQVEGKLNKAIDLDFQRRETIEQLQARIAELENGRGEPIYEIKYLREGGGGWCEVEKHQFDTASNLKNFRTRIVFAAPPAPVATLWEIRIPDEPQNPESPAEYFYAQNTANRDLLLLREGASVVAEYACLDATAALNEVKK